MATAAVAFLLLMPVKMSPAGSFQDAVGNMAHVGLFAALAWLWGRALPAWIRGWRLWLALALLAAGLEWLQNLTGRTAQPGDWFYGIGGAACICWTWNLRRSQWFFRWGTLLGLCLVPLAWIYVLASLESQSFPTLVVPSAAWSRCGWTLNGVHLASAASGGLKFERDWAAGEKPAYSGAFRPALRGNWRGMSSLQAEMFWPMETPAVFALRVDDRQGNPSYLERFQHEFSVSQGWNNIVIPVIELERTAGGRPLSLGTIRQWGVFLVSDVPFDYFLLGPVRLEMQKETP